MKTRFLFVALLAILCVAIESNAQNAFADAVMYSPIALASDSVTDAGNTNLSATIGKPKQAYNVIATFTKISGTLGGTAKLQGSQDNSNWFDAGTNYTVTNVASQTNSWVIAGTAFPYKYIRILWTGTGTMAGSYTAKVYTANY